MGKPLREQSLLVTERPAKPFSSGALQDLGDMGKAKLLEVE